jgi:ATP-dependent Lon protease
MPSVEVSDLDEQTTDSEEPDSSATPAIPEELPILPLRGIVVYPLMVLPLTVGQARSVRLVDDVAVGDRLVGLVASEDPELDEPDPDQVYQMGTAALIHRLIHIDEWITEEPYLKAKVSTMPDDVPEEGDVEAEALMRNVVDLFGRLVALVPHLPDELMMAAASTDDPRQLVYLISTSMRMELQDAQEILELDQVTDKLRRLTNILNRELEVLELGKKIQSEAQSEMEKMQREYFLREQLKAIQRELGEGDEQQMEIEELRTKIAEAGMPDEAEKEALRELSRLEKLPPAAAEYGVIRTYLDWLTSLPWSVTTQDTLDIVGHHPRYP